MKLLMITGDRTLAQGKRGAFYNTLEEFHKYWDRIDIICPKVNSKQLTVNRNFLGNVYVWTSPRPLIFQPFWILQKGREILKTGNWKLETGNWVMTVHEYPPFYNGIGARLLHNKTGIPYILEIHHIPGYPKAADLKEYFYRLATRLFIRYDASKAKAVRVVNQRQVPEFLTKAGVPKDKIIYIPSFYIDLDVFKPADPPTGGEKIYDLIFAGRLVKNKGLNLLLEAMKMLNTKYLIHNTKLLIVGDGSLKEDLKFKIKNLKLQDNVLLHGWAKDSQEVAHLLNQSRVLVMPSYNEGGPRVLLEAMACGVPVLATPVGIVPDIIREGESGGIIDWDPVDIARKALELLEDGSKYKNYAARGLEIARRFEKFPSIKNYAEKLQKI